MGVARESPNNKSTGGISAVWYRVRARNAQGYAMRNPTTQKDYQNEAVEPPIIANITIFYGVVVIRYL